ncbi:hypothetical protein [Haloferax sulfurifontis]|uniref:Uncharacterized protein n=1 Tax=Haloferax sulfurifontis TaxID=255616 RepID=A0A830EDG6_9EURY|nr:hypothetical protein [Haloferax sulfurifontis]GGC72432.1 hypothetical protein GCM10007209_37940 [Haloferax sulfurifontis]
MTLYECPRCGTQTATNDTCVGAFELPPTLYCVHDDTKEAVKMDVLSKADVREEVMVDA